MTAPASTRDVYRVTFTEFNKTFQRTLFVVVIVEETDDKGQGEELHRATRFDRQVAEAAADRWAELNGYTITQVRDGAQLPK